MICPICGYESSGNYCSNCGAPLEKDKDGYFFEEFDIFDEVSEDWLEYEEREFPEEENTYASDRRRNKNTRQEKRTPESRPLGAGKEKENNSRNTRAKEAKNDKREQKKQQKERQKEQRKRDERVKLLENEVEQLRLRQRTEPAKSEAAEPETAMSKRSYIREAREENRNSDHEEFEGRPPRPERRDSESPDFGEAVAKGVVGIVVLISRLMQLASTVLMACLVLTMARSFWLHGQALGDIRLALEERNYGLAFYVAFAGITLFMGSVWCLWILSRKGAGGGVRLKKYDTGRGFWPFLICIGAILITGITTRQIVIVPEAWNGIGSGVKAVLEAVNAQWEILLFSSTAGAVLSLVRKMMRV